MGRYGFCRGEGFLDYQEKRSIIRDMADISHPIHGSDPYVLHMLASERLQDANISELKGDCADHLRALREEALDLEQTVAFQFLEDLDADARGPIFVRAASIAYSLGDYSRCLDLIELGRLGSCAHSGAILEEIHDKVIATIAA